jgi:hypothetical protein
MAAVAVIKPFSLPNHVLTVALICFVIMILSTGPGTHIGGRADRKCDSGLYRIPYWKGVHQVMLATYTKPRKGY